MSTSFSKVLARAAELAPGALALDVPDDWMQGRSAFGGLQAAFALRAMRTLVPEEILRTLQVLFVAPAPAGARIEVAAQVLRKGKSATHVEARIWSGAETVALVFGVFGAARISQVARTPRQEPVPAPANPPELRYSPGRFPTFVQHFQARWLRGKPPYSGDTATEQVLELGLHDEGPATEAHVIALADFIPPVAVSLLTTPAPGSTLTWMLELLQHRLPPLPLSGWRVDAEMVAARDGYTSQSVTLWGPDGSAVALSRQAMLIFG